MTQTLTAQDIFRSAYENRYTWDTEFPGYTATATMDSDGQKYTAQVIVKADLSFEVTDIEDKEVKKAIQGQLWEMTIHRVRRSFAETHGDNTFSFGEKDENGAVEILVEGASMGNSYKIKDDTVCFVNRRIRDKVININTLKTLMTESGYLSEKYESFYLNPETSERETGVTTFEDKFAKFGDYYLLVNRKIETTDSDGKPQTIEFTFSDIQLLS